MLNLWEKSKITVYFEDEDGEQQVAQTFSHLTKDATPDAIGAVAQAIASLSDLPLAHAIVTDSQRYVI